MTLDKPQPMDLQKSSNGFWKTKLTKIIDDPNVSPKHKVICYLISKTADTVLYLVGIWMWLNA